MTEIDDKALNDFERQIAKDNAVGFDAHRITSAHFRALIAEVRRLRSDFARMREMAKSASQGAARVAAMVMGDGDHGPAPGEMAVNDPAAFWRSLTPAQAAELIDSAPRVAGAWHITKDHDGGEYWQRLFIRPLHPYDTPSQIAFVGLDGSWGASRNWDMGDDAEGRAASVDVAKATADEVLRSKGWVLG